MSGLVKVTPVVGTTERLLAVADLFEHNPDAWNQDDWSDVWSYVDELEVPEDDITNRLPLTARTHSCGSEGCQAGWLVALLPDAEFTNLIVELGNEPHEGTWQWFGRRSGGMSAELASWMFEGTRWDGEVEACIEGLRLVASIPEEERRDEAHAVRIINELRAIAEMYDVERNLEEW